jgi:uncharacterized protein YndB with AHSA1/START domain
MPALPIEPIRLTRTVNVSVERAFAYFVDGMAQWWPPEYTWAGDVLEWIAIETRLGGRCYERGPHGFSLDWGRVLAWEPPNRLAFTWQISPARVPEPNPERASEIAVRFVAEGPETTRVEFEQLGFERHGENASAYRDALADEQGWPYILGRFVAGQG